MQTIQIDTCEDVEISVRERDGYSVLKIEADGNTINLYCSEAQLDSIAAAIQAAKHREVMA